MRRECERTWRRTRGTPRAEATPPLRDVDALLFFIHVFPLTTQRHLTRPDPTAATLRSDSYLCSDHTPENIAGFCSSGSHQDTSWVNIPGSLIGKIQKIYSRLRWFFCLLWIRWMFDGNRFAERSTHVTDMLFPRLQKRVCKLSARLDR